MTNGLIGWLDDRGLDHLWVAFTDFSGRLAGRNIPRQQIPVVLDRGTNFAKANFNFTLNDEQAPQPRFGANTGDVLAVPEPETVVPIPHQPRTALAFANLLEEDGRIWPGCSRTVLKRAVAALTDAGLAARVAFEPEFYLFAADGQTPASQGGMYSIEALDWEMEFVRRLADALPPMGVTLEQIGKEYGAGQFEANIAPAHPVSAVDDFILLRLAVRGVARQLGLQATFMPKFDQALAGCGLHLHLSLQDAATGEDRTGADQQPSGLSETARAFSAGWLEHADALCGLGSPTANSHKRLQPASWAPAHVCWGVGNRAALVRVPGPGQRARLEFRAGDNTANPFLFLAGLIWAGLDGVRRQLDPGEPTTEDTGQLSTDQLAGRGIRFLPRTLPEALAALERDQVIASGLGELPHQEFLRVKRAEFGSYSLQVSDWERRVYRNTP